MHSPGWSSLGSLPALAFGEATRPRVLSAAGDILRAMDASSADEKASLEKSCPGRLPMGVQTNIGTTLQRKWGQSETDGQTIFIGLGGPPIQTHGSVGLSRLSVQDEVQPACEDLKPRFSEACFVQEVVADMPVLGSCEVGTCLQRICVWAQYGLCPRKPCRCLRGFGVSKRM